jgi:hypothetical protein
MKQLSIALLASVALAAPAFAQNTPATPPAAPGNTQQQFGQKSDEHFEERQKMEQEFFQKRQAIEQKYHAQFKALAEQEHAEMEQLHTEIMKHHPGMGGEHMGGAEGQGMNGGQPPHAMGGSPTGAK